jgi:uncharacterized membrane protein required for colicin V production
MKMSSLKLVSLFTFVLGVVGVIFGVWAYFNLPHTGDKLNQVGVDALIDELRTGFIQFIPTLSVWMIFVSICVWRYLRKNNSD